MKLLAENLTIELVICVCVWFALWGSFSSLKLFIIIPTHPLKVSTEAVINETLFKVSIQHQFAWLRLSLFFLWNLNMSKCPIGNQLNPYTINRIQKKNNHTQHKLNAKKPKRNSILPKASQSNYSQLHKLQQYSISSSSSLQCCKNYI